MNKETDHMDHTIESPDRPRHRRHRRRWLRRSAVAACASTTALLLPTGSAQAQLPPPTGCTQIAEIPVAGFGGVGGRGSINCYDIVDPSSLFIIEVKLWKRDANYNWTLVTQEGNSCVAGNDAFCTTDAWAFQLFTEPGWYHTEVINVSTAPLCSPCRWVVNSGELAVK
jgi:hypothetical protein